MGRHNESKEHISIDSVRIWYEALLQKYNAINNGNTSIDTKLGILLGVATALFVFASDRMESLNFNWMLIVGLLMTIFASLFAFKGMRVSDSITPVNNTKDRPDYYNKNDEEFIWQLIADVEDATNKNLIANESKSKNYKLSFGFLVIAVILIVLSQFISYNQNQRKDGGSGRWEYRQNNNQIPHHHTR